ncbi:MAG: PP2C family protein-serine/threonine phosphatase [Lachnospiraceae bacterium]|nr:PP2C family protein-serine/threonine phosphatase [Lachnospiraceae bacterium]
MKRKERMNKEKHNMETEFSAINQNEMEANLYVARSLVACSGVAVFLWILDFLGVFPIPLTVMSIGVLIMVLAFWAPTLICKATGGKPSWVKYAGTLCSVVGVFAISCTLPKHGVLIWTLPIMLSCHYYSKKLTKITLIESLFLFPISVIIGLYFGEWDTAMLDAPYYSGPRIITQKTLYEAIVFFAFPRALVLFGETFVCTSLAKRTRGLLKRQIAESEERQRISTELDVATQIQADMLPRIFPAFPERPEFDIYATMNPAKEVGGDFYDFFMVDDKHLAIVVADVSGKGVPAALFMVIGKTLIKDHTKPGCDLGEVFTEVNDILCESNNKGLFITAFEGVLNLVTGELRFVNAGHEMPFIAKEGNTYESYKIPAAFVLAGLEGMHYTGGSIKLAPGDKIFQYTDGVTEATNADQELYGMERLEEVLAKNTALPPEELLATVKEDVDAFVGEAPQFDDITMLCLEYKAQMETA